MCNGGSILMEIKKMPAYSSLYEEVIKLYEMDEPKIIAIDGRCGSGKTILAEILNQEIDINVFHMDDFFVPFEMKTKERHLEPGGNVHYERFSKEVLTPLLKEKEVVHQRYNPQIRALDEPIYTEPKKLTIVEGSYSLHPLLIEAYDLKIFLTINSEEQLERIRKRNGEEKLQDFITKWIPREELYFRELNIIEKCQFTIDTSNIW